MKARALLVVGLLLTMGLAGCLGDEGAAGEPASPDVASITGRSMPDLAPPTVRNGTLHVDVDIPVVTIGFPTEAEQELAERLDNETVQHWSNRGVPVLDPRHRAQETASGSPPTTDRTEGDPLFYPAPVSATARYHVEPASHRLEVNLTEFAGRMSTPGDANRLEAFLADALAGDGVDVDPNRPLLVLLDSRSLEGAPDAWNYTFPVSNAAVGQGGAEQTVAVFGEQEPLLVADIASLRIDPSKEVEAVEDLVRNATRFRLLQGPIKETPFRTCHAVTVITAYRPATSAGAVPASFVHEERIRQAFENLSSQPVHVDTKELVLPEDDPGLDAAFRASVGWTLATQYQGVREWIAANWEEYWIEHEGCSAYVSVVLFTAQPHGGQAAPGRFCSSAGTGTYDQDTRYRIAVSRVSDFLCGFGAMNLTSTYLHLHETGHLFGLAHPHEILTENPVRPATLMGDPPAQMNHRFATVWSAMSYATGFHVQDFGTMDRANFERNQAAQLLVAAHEQGLDGEPAYERALEHVGDYEWTKASDELEPIVAAAQENQSDGTTLRMVP